MLRFQLQPKVEGERVFSYSGGVFHSGKAEWAAAAGFEEPRAVLKCSGKRVEEEDVEQTEQKARSFAPCLEGPCSP